MSRTQISHQAKVICVRIGLMANIQYQQSSNRTLLRKRVIEQEYSMNDSLVVLSTSINDISRNKNR